MHKQYSLFIGRYQCFHNGHKHIIDTEINKGNNVLIAIRDVANDDKNIFTAQQVLQMIHLVYKNEINNETVKVIIIPDIARVMYGRDVGYEVNEIKVDDSIKQISATSIRNLIANNDNTWKELVPMQLHNHFPKLFNQTKKIPIRIKKTWLLRTVLKAATYRLMGTTTTVLVSLVITNHLSTSLAIGCIEAIIKIGNYTLHEWLWKGK